MKNINTTKTTAYVCFSFGSCARVGVTLYEGLTVDECIALRSEDIEEYKIEGGEWTTRKATADEARQHLEAIRNEEETETTESTETVEETAEEIVEAVEQKVSEIKTRSAWERGVKAYAEELVEELREAVEGGYVDADELSNRRLFERAMLNGAADWKQYSEGGCSLCYDGQIAERLCAPWELRKTESGRKDPNPRETWIDVQSRALTQAARLVLRVAF